MNGQVGNNIDDEGNRRPQFGNRYLTSEHNAFEHNAWDNVVWGEEQEREAIVKTQQQYENRMPSDLQETFEMDADRYWDKFYNVHQNRFFKDRHWLFTEFPELAGSKTETNVTESQYPIGGAEYETTSSKDAIETVDSEPFTIFEVGCGAGNSVFPVLRTHKQDVMLFCCDFSETAIQLVKENIDYDPVRTHAFVHDITSTMPLPFNEHSIDAIILIFVLSAIHPDKLEDAVKKLVKYLKPGGLVLFRDYGRYDMAQLRFKNESCLSENFYARGDGTRVYFFTQEEVRALFTKAGLDEVQNVVDRRLQVNRSRHLKMYRVWIQSKYRVPISHNKCITQSCEPTT